MFYLIKMKKIEIIIALIFFDINPVVVIIVSGLYGAIFLRGKV